MSTAESDLRFLRGVSPKTLRTTYKKAAQAGCRLSLTKKNHIRIATPGGALIIGSLTASDHRTEQNLRSKLRREGVTV